MSEQCQAHPSLYLWCRHLLLPLPPPPAPSISNRRERICINGSSSDNSASDWSAAAVAAAAAARPCCNAAFGTTDTPAPAPAPAAAALVGEIGGGGRTMPSPWHSPPLTWCHIVSTQPNSSLSSPAQDVSTYAPPSGPIERCGQLVNTRDNVVAQE